MRNSTRHVIHLRSEIRKLTGCQPRSFDPSYLRSRLAAILARQAKGLSVKGKSSSSELVVPVSIGLPFQAAKALRRVAQNCGKSASFIAKEALGRWMRAEGYHVEAAAFDQPSTAR